MPLPKTQVLLDLSSEVLLYNAIGGPFEAVFFSSSGEEKADFFKSIGTSGSVEDVRNLGLTRACQDPEVRHLIEAAIEVNRPDLLSVLHPVAFDRVNIDSMVELAAAKKHNACFPALLPHLPKRFFNAYIRGAAQKKNAPLLGAFAATVFDAGKRTKAMGACIDHGFMDGLLAVMPWADWSGKEGLLLGRTISRGEDDMFDLLLPRVTGAAHRQFAFAVAVNADRPDLMERLRPSLPGGKLGFKSLATMLTSYSERGREWALENAMAELCGIKDFENKLQAHAKSAEVGEEVLGGVRARILQARMGVQIEPAESLVPASGKPRL